MGAVYFNWCSYVLSSLYTVYTLAMPLHASSPKSQDVASRHPALLLGQPSLHFAFRKKIATPATPVINKIPRAKGVTCHILPSSPQPKGSPIRNKKKKEKGLVTDHGSFHVLGRYALTQRRGYDDGGGMSSWKTPTDCYRTKLGFGLMGYGSFRQRRRQWTFQRLKRGDERQLL